MLLVLFFIDECFPQWQWINPKPQGNNLSSVYFTSPTTGYAVGNWGTIMKSTDGGLTWATMPSGTTEDLVALFFTSPAAGYAVGTSGTILKTEDAGA